jgi:hypothetical protein
MFLVNSCWGAAWDSEKVMMRISLIFRISIVDL